MAEEKAHSPVGASACERFFNCPGSNALIEKSGSPNTSSEYAAWGTVAHEIGETTIKAGQLGMVTVENPYSDKIIGVQKVVDGFKITVDEEMLDTASQYLLAIKGYCDAYKMPYSSVKAEEKFKLPQIDKEAMGTVDAYLEVPMQKLIVFDLKTGFKQVEVKANKQLMYYALGIVMQNDIEVDEIELVIVQPRGFHKDGVVRSWTCSMRELLAFSEELKTSIQKTRTSNELVTGSWCKYCNASMICPQAMKETLSLAQVQFSDLGVVGTLNMPSVIDMTPEYMSNVLKFVEKFENFVDCVRAKAFDMLDRGVGVPGFKLVPKRANRSWEDENEATKQMNTDLPDGAFVITKKLITPAVAEKAYKKLRKEMPKTVRVETGFTLVRDTDDRQAKPALEASFTKIVSFDDL
jgi:hypothetical protein